MVNHSFYFLPDTPPKPPTLLLTNTSSPRTDLISCPIGQKLCLDFPETPQAKCLDLPEMGRKRLLRHVDYRKVQNAKRDALIGIVRIFEQMLAKDLSYVPGTVLGDLKSLRDDLGEPMTVNKLAKNALETWSR